MPNYTYTDGKIEIQVTHPYEWDGTIISGTGVVMWKKPPTGVAINWGGLSPSALENQSPELQQHIKNADRARDEYWKNKSQRKDDG